MSTASRDDYNSDVDADRVAEESVAASPSSGGRSASASSEPYPGASRPGSTEGWLHRLSPRLRQFIVHNILHLDDSPHRIALGVFLGFVVGATPLVGVQTILYLALATVLRANRVSGIGPVWITNPLTIVPIYYANWRIGVLLLTGSFGASAETRVAIERLVAGAPGQDLGWLERLWSAEFWAAAWELLLSIGAELWVGSLFVGVVTGLLGYWLTLRAVISYRARRRAAASH